MVSEKIRFGLQKNQNFQQQFTSYDVIFRVVGVDSMRCQLPVPEVATVVYF